MKRHLLILTMLVITGCSTVYFQPTDPNSDYLIKIEHWQNRIRHEGWTNSLIDNIVKESLELVMYEPEQKSLDRWKTYKEFLQDFKGDCEDITTFLYGTFKVLNYPDKVRMRIIRMPAGDHAVLMVKMINSKWKMYNSVPFIGDFLDIALARTVVEWDDNRIYYQ